jgi:hypothetical protein
MEDMLGALERARTRRPIAAIAVVVAVLLAAGAAGARVWSHHEAPAAAPQAVAHASVPPPPAAAPPPAAPPRPAPPPAVAVAPPDAGTRELASNRPASPLRHKRQVAQQSPAPPVSPASPTGPVSPTLPPSTDPKELLDRADALADKREGAACLAVLDQIHDVPADMVARANIIRGDCEMLAGHCEAGRKILEPMYESDRRFSPAAAKGVLSARVARMCPVASFPTVGKRVLAVSLQADEAKGAQGEQSRWCGALERALLADTQSPEVQACYGDKKSEACISLRFNLENAYERLAECFLRDKNCREGARLDVMHSQVGWGSIDVANKRINLFCRPSRVVEVYPICTPDGEVAERKCLEHVEAARRVGDERVQPLFPR